MSKTIFIIAGFKHKASEEQYAWMRDFFESKGFIVQTPDIEWDNQVMTHYIAQFSEYYSKHKTAENYVLGFSFGAMIAMISAPVLRPERLILCSLSPYFKEDLGSLKPTWRKYIGHRRFEDFKKYNAVNLAKQLDMPTSVIFGGAEGKLYPRLKYRCEQTAQHAVNCKLFIAGSAPHRIDYPTYTSTIKSVFSNL